jgi:phosphoserine aminotransferase
MEGLIALSIWIDWIKLYFLSGGGKFRVLVPYNLMKDGGKAAYLDTGTWASGAIKETQFLGNSSCCIIEGSKTNNIPKGYSAY